MDEKDYEKILANIEMVLENARKIRDLTETERIILHVIKG